MPPRLASDFTTRRLHETISPTGNEAGGGVSNKETEDFAVDVVMGLEREAAREPEDVRRAGAQWDVTSPPRNIEVKAFGGSARGAGVPLEKRQVEAAWQTRQPSTCMWWTTSHWRWWAQVRWASE